MNCSLCKKEMVPGCLIFRSKVPMGFEKKGSAELAEYEELAKKDRSLELTEVWCCPHCRSIVSEITV